MLKTTNGADLLLRAIDAKSNPSIVGLDPDLTKLPLVIKQAALTEHQDPILAACSAIVRFNREIIDAVADIVGIVKPQIAFYEQYGAPGIQAFQDTVTYAKQKGLIVVEDGKRGDIGTTAEAYACGHLGEVTTFSGKVRSLDVNWLTVNPYLGDDGVMPFVKACKEYGKGIFVLVKTSNPSASQFQDIKVDSRNTPIFHDVAASVAALAETAVGERGYSSIGAVVGATYPEDAVQARRIMSKSIFLVPGYGAQGGVASDLIPFFNEDGYGAVISSSRGVIYAYQQERYADLPADSWARAVRESAIEMRDSIISEQREFGRLPRGW